MNNYINEIINTKIDFLKSSYISNKNVNHQGIKGSLNEILFLELVKDLIPNRFKLSKGIVQDSSGFQSSESDIILYNNEILPALLFGLELGFVPCEAVEYIFEIKSTLNSKELDTTIEKFKNLKKCIGYRRRNVLFSFSSDIKSKSELERYYEKDNAFLYNPFIKGFCVLNKGYYFFSFQKIYLKDSINKNDFVKLCIKQNKYQDMIVGDNSFKIEYEVENIDVNIEKNLIINGINYEDIYFTYYCWAGIEDKKGNCNLLGLFSGISNTLCKEKFGTYLLSSCIENSSNIYTEYIVDMWNNERYKKIDFNGFKKTILNSNTFTLSLNNDGKLNKLIIYEGKQECQ